MLSDPEAIIRCIQIAKNGLGTTRPNPMVGAIIVQNNKIIGEGFTSSYGGPHAEVQAINSVIDKSLLNSSTLYVTLEPCCHHGKTPPCSDLIIRHKIPRVVIGCLDDNPQVAGKGIAKLKAAGCRVTVGVLEDDCKNHHKRFFTFINKKRPYIILKWAESQDGFLAPKNRNEQAPVWITNTYSRQLVHKWRAQEQAILVGGRTVFEDNPSLTTRDWGGDHPLRVVWSSKSNWPKDLHVFNKDSATYLSKEPIKQLLDTLYKKNINSLIVEGGSKTLQSFIDQNIWDEARVFHGKAVFETGISAPTLKRKPVNSELILSDTLETYIND